MTTFLKWTGLTTAALICGGVALGALSDLVSQRYCYSAADGPMFATFALFALAGGVLAGLLALMIRSVGEDETERDKLRSECLTLPAPPDEPA